MAKVKITCKKKSGEVLYSGVKAEGPFDELFKRLQKVARKIYGDNRRMCGIMCFGRTYYFKHDVCGYEMTYSIIK